MTSSPIVVCICRIAKRVYGAVGRVEYFESTINLSNHSQGGLSPRSIMFTRFLNYRAASNLHCHSPIWRYWDGEIQSLPTLIFHFRLSPKEQSPSRETLLLFSETVAAIPCRLPWSVSCMYKSVRWQRLASSEVRGGHTPVAASEK
jgi:hypothetical protein